MTPDPVLINLKRMSALLRALARAAGEGTHELTVVYFSAEEAAVRSCDLQGPVLDEVNASDDLIRVAELLINTALRNGLAVIILRTPLSTGTAAVKTWFVDDLITHPLTAAQAFHAGCIGPYGELTGPEPGTEYHDAPRLTSSIIPMQRKGY